MNSLFKEDFYVFPESTRVVIPDGFGVPEGLQERVGLQDLLGDEVVSRLIDCREVLHD